MAPSLKNLTAEEKKERLLKLKLIPELKRTDEEKDELAKLNETLQARELKKKRGHKPGTVSVLTDSQNLIDLIEQKYNEAFLNTPNYVKPIISKGITINGVQYISITLTFKSEEQAANFYMGLAKFGSFKVMDAQGSLIASSDGQKLLHANNKPFEPGDSFTPLATGKQNQIMQNQTRQNLQQNPQLTPLMTAPKSTVQMKPRIPATPAVKPLMNTTQDSQAQQTPPAVKPATPRPTPFKRTPFEQ